MSKLSVTLGAALALSLGANVWQSLDEDQGPARSPIKSPSSSSAGPRVGNTQVREVEVCEKKLAQCDVARRAAPALFGGMRCNNSSEGRSAADVESEPAAFLCELAREHAATLWREKEAAILFAMRTSLADPEIQAKDLDVAVERFGDHLDLSQSDRETLASRYEDVRLARIEKVRTIISEDPPDYAAVIHESRELFAEEDKIAGELFGEDAAKKIRDGELESRSTILSIAASLGQLPWTENAIP